MNDHEKYEVFSQLMYLVLKCKSILGNTKSDSELSKSLEAMKEIIGKYYQNFDRCPECGHPVPSLPSVILKKEIDPVVSSYIETFEYLSGVSQEEFKRPKRSIIEPVEEKVIPKIVLPPKLSELGSGSKRLNVMKAKLIKVGS